MPTLFSYPARRSRITPRPPDIGYGGQPEHPIKSVFYSIVGPSLTYALTLSPQTGVGDSCLGRVPK